MIHSINTLFCTSLSIKYRLVIFVFKYRPRSRSLWKMFLSVVEAWAEAESAIQKSFTSYCMTRFQKNQSARTGVCFFLVLSPINRSI